MSTTYGICTSVSYQQFVARQELPPCPLLQSEQLYLRLALKEGGPCAHVSSGWQRTACTHGLCARPHSESLANRACSSPNRFVCLRFRYVFLKYEQIKVLVEHPVVPTMQGNAVIKHETFRDPEIFWAGLSQSVGTGPVICADSASPFALGQAAAVCLPRNTG